MKFSSWIRALVLGLVLATGLTAAATALARPHGAQHRHHGRHGRHQVRKERIGLANHTSLERNPLRLRRAPQAAPAAAESGVTLFEGNQINDYAMLQEAPGAITEVPDPAGSGESVFKMTVSNNDVAPITPTDNPRAQA